MAAFRNLTANKLVSAIAILGLSVGIAAAILMGLVVRNQMSFDHFIPGHQRLYRAVPSLHNPATVCNDVIMCGVQNSSIELFRLKLPEIESLARLVYSSNTPVRLSHGNVNAWEDVYWADANAFDIFRLPVLQGDLATALARPDGIVLTRAIAEKYFGRAAALGQAITMDGRPMVVRAVIADLPANGTTLKTGIFVSGLSPVSKLLPPGASGEVRAARNVLLPISETYLRLRPGASAAAVAQRATDLNWSALSAADRETITKAGMRRDFDVWLLPLDRINLTEAFNPGIGLRLPAAIIAGLLVLFIAGINFVNLTVARAVRREKEVGVRKACGAGRATLTVQFLGEAMIAVALAAAIALALSEWLLPPLNAFLDTGAGFTPAGDSLLLPAMALAVLLLGLSAGAYPALILSGFRPGAILRGRSGGSGLVRNVLVTLQFAILIVLAIAACVIWRQHDYATRQALRIDTDQMLVIRTTRNGPAMARQDMSAPEACPASFRDEVARLPGVRGAFCSAATFLDENWMFGWIKPDGSLSQNVRVKRIDARLLSLYGIKPLAGSLPPVSGAGAMDAGVIVSQSALRRLGFASPQAAIGKNFIPAEVPAAERRRLENTYPPAHNIVTAVVPDFTFTSLGQANFTERLGTIYTPWVRTIDGTLVHIKLDGRRIPETLAAIDQLWEATNQVGRMDRFFLDDHIEQLYRNLSRQALFLAACAGITILLACLGLVGIAIATAERRTKEIGVRKALGATTPRIVGLLLWQFSLPVLLGSLIAWPIAFWLMRRWLAGFAWHIELQWWMFAAASGAALVLALLTVAGQAIQTARQKPVLALRYE